VRAGAGTLMAAFNDGGVLPIAASARTIAVIGPFADAPGEQLGVWAAEARAADSVTPLAAIVARTAGRRVLHSTGVSVASLVPPSASGSGGKPPAPNSAIGVAGSGAATGPVSIEHAAAAARDADVELLFLGEPALADVLLGDAAPSGRLPVSWPRSVGQIPVFFGHKSTGRPMTADRWHTGYQYESSAPLYPFGHGLTYTSFGYSNLRITPATLSAGGTVTVSADLANEGKRADTEVVQLYVRDRVASTTRPVRELEGFARVTLAAGERRTVELPLAAAELSCFDPEGGWTPGDGEFDVWVGPDAASGLHATLEVAAPAAP
jgi:beta-glucosidase